MPIAFQTKKTIFLKNHRMMIQIGVHPHEKINKQPLMLNVEIETHAQEENDSLEKTLDYEKVYIFLESLPQQSFSCELQETLARKILDFIFSFEKIIYACVEVAKTAALEKCEAVGVRLERFSNNHILPK